jgi:hypothetical protein
MVVAPGSRVREWCGVGVELGEGSTAPVRGRRWPATVGRPWETKQMSWAEKSLAMTDVESRWSPAQGGGGDMLRRLWWCLGAGSLMTATAQGRESRVRWECGEVAEGLPSRGSFIVVKWSTPQRLDKGDLSVHVGDGEFMDAGWRNSDA